MARKLGEAPSKTSTSPGRSTLSVTAGDWPASRAASRRTTAADPARRAASSSAASSGSETKIVAAAANAGTATSVTSRAVRVRSSVVPIRVAASLSRSGPGWAGTAGAGWMITRAPPGPAGEPPGAGSQCMVAGPSARAKARSTVAVHGRSAPASASACASNSRWPGRLSRTSPRCCPVISLAVRPNKRAAVTDQEVTSPAASTVSTAKLAPPAPRRRGGAGSSAPALRVTTASAPILAQEHSHSWIRRSSTVRYCAITKGTALCEA